MLERIKAQSLEDGDELAQLMMRELRQALDSAPVVTALEGREVSLPGFVVPLESSPQGLSEFLLVPCFGACIHAPPPPANQIVHVRSSKPLGGTASMIAVWVRGTLSLCRIDSGMGVSAYATQLARGRRRELTHGGRQVECRSRPGSTPTAIGKR